MAGDRTGNTAGDPARDGRAWLAWADDDYADDDYFDGPGELMAPQPLAEAGLASWADDGRAWGAERDAYPAAAAFGPAAFGPGGPAESMAPGAGLGTLVERAVRGDLAEMPDDEVLGVVAAARRLRRRAEWLELRATREFAHRRWEADQPPARDKHGRWRFSNSAAEHAADEIAFHLTDNRAAAQDRMDLALALRDRLPAMDALVAAGKSDERRCQAVHDITCGLSDDHARRVDAALAPDAAGLGYDALRRRAAKLATSLDPESERERRQRATAKKARVEKFIERSGNYAFAGRELPVEEALACEAYIRGLAAYLRARGVTVSQRAAELMCYLDLTQGRDPRDRIPADPGHPEGSGYSGHGNSGRAAGANDGSAPDGGAYDDGAYDAGAYDDSARDGCSSADESGDGLGPGDGDAAGGDDDGGDDGGAGGDDDGGGAGRWPFSPPGPGKPGGRAPFPASINLLVPVGTLLGWSTMPGEAGRDIIGPEALRDLVRAASHHRATRWCVTITGDDRTAIAHGCARGQHPWDGKPAPPQAARVTELLARLGVTLAPIAEPRTAEYSAPEYSAPEYGAPTYGGDEQRSEPGYRPSRRLQHLIRARTATCPAPGCGASSHYCDIDHTIPWPEGPTAEDNLGPPCRHHHRAKQAPGWTLEQPEPGVFRWTTPSGRVYETRPTRYDI
jgi:uncharacterized protein DUF222